MVKLLALFAVIGFLVSCKHKESRQLEISGTIKDSNDKFVYLEETQLATGERIIADSSLIANDGSYHLAARTGEESLYSLFLKSQTFPIAYVVNDVPSITVNVDAKDQNGYEVKNSPASESLKDFSIKSSSKYSELYLMGRKMDSLKKSGAADSTVTNLNDVGQTALNGLKNYVTGYIENSGDPITSMWALGTYSQIFSVNEYQQLLSRVATKFPAHKGVAAIKEMNDRQLALSRQKSQEPEETEWVNKQAPDLSLPDVHGKKVELSSFKGKYLLVDFWASWCLPCRHENPNVVKAYNKYKNKNFAILGVSLDKEKDDWLNAIQEDKLDWTQVSDLQEWNSIAVSTFNFSGIPFNVLIDPNGKVIAQSLRGDELEKKLQEVLQ